MKASRPFGLAQVSLDCAGCFRSFTRFAVCTENLIRVDDVMEPPKLAGMLGPLCFVLALLAAPIKSKLRFETENAALRHQLTVLRRRLQGRARPDCLCGAVLLSCGRWCRAKSLRTRNHRCRSALSDRLQYRSGSHSSDADLVPSGGWDVCYSTAVRG